MSMVTIVYVAFIGTVAGLLWGTAFGVNVSTSLKIGSILGIIIGILFTLIGKAATTRKNVMQSEVTFVNSSIMTAIAIFIIGAGLLAWVIRLIFF